MQPSIVDVLGEILDFLQTVDPTVFVAHCIAFTFKNMDCMCRVDDGASWNKTYPYSAYIMLPLSRMFFCSFHGEKPMILNSRLNAVAFLFD